MVNMLIIIAIFPPFVKYPTAKVSPKTKFKNIDKFTFL